MNYFFCAAHTSFLVALYLKSKGEPICIITHNKAVTELCGHMGIEHKYISRRGLNLGFPYPLIPKPFSLEVFKKNIIRSAKALSRIPVCLKILIDAKKRLNVLVRELAVTRDDSFIFYSHVMDYFQLYLAKKLSKKCRVYYRRPGLTDAECRPFTKHSARQFNYRDTVVIKCMENMVFGLNLVLYEGFQGWKVTTGVDIEKFRLKYGIDELAADKDHIEIQMEAIRNNRVIDGEYDYLFIDSDLLIWITEDSIKKMYEEIAALKEKALMKAHPLARSDSKTARGEFSRYFAAWEDVPAYIPAELTFGNINKAVLSVVSVSLLTAAAMKQVKVISLMDLLEWTDTVTKAKLKDYFSAASGGQILFPQSYEELERMLS
ncbi:MAG: hypothetical protein JXJ19_03125 [Elusimicrobia bacterium]|nr:hypothetical protein [Elusimicrobiota bacterium]